jgi:hypothetical protein
MDLEDLQGIYNDLEGEYKEFHSELVQQILRYNYDRTFGRTEKQLLT